MSVILRERSDRRISINRGKTELLHFAQDDKRGFCQGLKGFSFVAYDPKGKKLSGF